MANRAIRRAAGCGRKCSTCPRRRRSTNCRWPPRFLRRLPPLEGYTFEGYSQPRWFGGHQEHPGHHHHRAMRGAHRGLRRAAHPGGDAAALSQRGRRGGHHAFLRLRRGHRCARRGGSHPHAAAHRPARQLRRRAAGGQPGMREAAARAAVRGGTADDCRFSGEATCIRLQDERGFGETVAAIMRAAEKRLAELEPAAAPDRAPRRNWWWACSAAAAMLSPASPAIRRWATRPTCWCAPAPRSCSPK